MKLTLLTDRELESLKAQVESVFSTLSGAMYLHQTSMDAHTYHHMSESMGEEYEALLRRSALAKLMQDAGEKIKPSLLLSDVGHSVSAEQVPDDATHDVNVTFKACILTAEELAQIQAMLSSIRKVYDEARTIEP